MQLNKVNAKIISYLSLLIIWQICSSIGWLKSELLPSPIAVFLALVQLIASGGIWIDIMTSLWRVLIGFLLAAIIGCGVGYATASNDNVKNYIVPLIEIFRPIPPVAFIPLAVLWFGIGNGPAYFLVCFGAFFPIFTNTFYGILSVNPIHINAALSLGANRRLLLLDVIFPAALPYITAGLKTGIGVAWFCVIAAELVGAQSGLGYMIQLNRLTLQSENVVVGMILIGVIGYFMNRIMTIIQIKLVPWSNNN